MANCKCLPKESKLNILEGLQILSQGLEHDIQEEEFEIEFLDSLEYPEHPFKGTAFSLIQHKKKRAFHVTSKETLQASLKSVLQTLETVETIPDC